MFDEMMLSLLLFQKTLYFEMIKAIFLRRQLQASISVHHSRNLIGSNCLRERILVSQKSSITTDSGHRSSEKEENQRIQAESNKSILGRAVSILLSALVLLGLKKGYEKYQTNKRRDSYCVPIKQSKAFKADVVFTRYKDCVLPKSMVTDGTMDAIEAFELRPEDVVVASFPKSGTTWLQEVVYLLHHIDTPEDPEMKDSVMETKFPYLEYPYPGLKNVSERKGRRFLKTHLPYHLLPQSLSSAKSKVLYIYRNPKDVAVSYYHFARGLTFLKFGPSFQKFATMFRHDLLPYTPFAPHILNYSDQAQKDPSQFLMVCYEAMKEDPRREIMKIAKFLNIELEEDKLDDIVAKTSFESMRSNPRTNYEHWNDYGLKVRGEANFMRKGQVGDYENYFDQILNQDFDEWIASRFGGKGFTFKYKIHREQSDQS